MRKVSAASPLTEGENPQSIDSAPETEQEPERRKISMKDDMRRTSRARRAQQRKRRNRRIALTLCVMFVVLAASIGGTVAWLTDKTDTIENTFTAGDINITLDETTTDYKMVPGADIAKNPKVTVEEGSEDCYLFVKIEESTNAKFSDFMTYEIDNTVWSPLTDVPGVYYRTVLATDTVKAFDVLKGNKVTVKEGVTKAQLNVLTEDTYPTLSFTAYAVQKDGINDAATAWAKVSA